MGRTSVLVLCLAACGGGGSSAGDGGIRDGALLDDGDPACTPAVACEDRDDVCGLHPDTLCGHVDCGTCQWSDTGFGWLPTVLADGMGGTHLVHIVRPSIDNEVTYVRLFPDGTVFSSEPIATVIRPTLARAPAIDVASDGTVHVVWATDESPEQLWWAMRTAPSTWTVENLGAGSFPDVVVDNDGHPHIAYESGGDPGALHITTRDDAGTWTDVEADAMMSRWPAMATDPSGAPHVAYVGYRNNGFVLLHATRASGAWASTPVVTPGVLNDSSFVDLAYDPAGVPHFAFANTGAAYLTDGNNEQITLATGQSRGEVAITYGYGPQLHAMFWGDDGLFYRTILPDGAERTRLVTDDCDDGHASVAVLGDQPFLAHGCFGAGATATPIGVYPPSYFAACDAAIAALCPFACACMPGTDCAYHGASTSTTFGPDSICPGWAREDLCSSDTIDPALIAPCADALAASDGACDGSSYPLPAACDPVTAGNQ